MLSSLFANARSPGPLEAMHVHAGFDLFGKLPVSGAMRKVSPEPDDPPDVMDGAAESNDSIFKRVWQQPWLEPDVREQLSAKADEEVATGKAR